MWFRSWLCLTMLAGLGGCDAVLGLHSFGHRPDAAIDGPPIDVAPAFVIGCRDGTREGFGDITLQPTIAGCGGGWGIAGLEPLTPAACEGGGNDDPGLVDSCRAADLCADGWHVCASSAETAAHLANGTDCTSLAPPAGVPAFFATRQSTSGAFTCAPASNDDIIGCGSFSEVDNLHNCLPLSHASGAKCVDLQPTLGGWNCPNNDDEIHTVTKLVKSGGGVLCCRDP